MKPVIEAAVQPMVFKGIDAGLNSRMLAPGFNELFRVLYLFIQSRLASVG